MEDILLKKFFEKPRWEKAIADAVEKGIDKSLLRELCSPERRIEIYRQIRDGTYVIGPPHEAQIPKDDGSMRTVYVNDGIDRVLLSIANDLFFEMCPEFVHERCGSYQKGIGCGKLVRNMSERIAGMEQEDVGAKLDLSKYFDSVPILYIDEVFDKIEEKFGPSALVRTIRRYYHTDTVIDLDKNLIEKYSSLRQGCAVAAFLADAVLYDVDDRVSAMDVDYVRYSDDILIVGKEWRAAFDTVSEMLAERRLVLNPKKIEYLSKGRWFTFLGFSLKDGMISLSPSRVRTFQKEIEDRTTKCKRKALSQAIKDVEVYLYRGNGEYSWATSVLPIVNVEQDIQALNAFAMDAIRACALEKRRIGGLGVLKDMPDRAITRGTGRHVASNKKMVPQLDGWRTLKCMRNAMLTSPEAYHALVMSI